MTRYASLALLFLGSALLVVIGTAFSLLWITRRKWVSIRGA